MTELLILTNEHLRCEIKPALGGCVAGLWFQGIPVLRSTPAQSLVSVRESGSFPLVPFSFSKKTKPKQEGKTNET